MSHGEDLSRRRYRRLLRPHIAGWLEDGKIKTEELYRFPNGVTELDGHLTWDIDALLSHVKKGIAIAKEKYPVIESLSIDTWGVDYVLLKGDEEVRPCYAYRDSRTEAVISKVHEKISFTFTGGAKGRKTPQSASPTAPLSQGSLTGRKGLKKAGNFRKKVLTRRFRCAILCFTCRTRGFFLRAFFRAESAPASTQGGNAHRS